MNTKSRQRAALARELGKFRLTPGTSRTLGLLTGLVSGKLREMRESLPYHVRDTFEVFRELSTDVIAARTLVTALDYALKRSPVYHVERRIGLDLWSELQMRRLDRAGNPDWTRVKGKTLTDRPARQAVIRRQYMQAVEQWIDLEPSLARDYGSVFLGLVMAWTGVIAAEPVVFNGRKTKVSVLVLTDEFEEYIADIVEGIQDYRPHHPHLTEEPDSWDPTTGTLLDYPGSFFIRHARKDTYSQPLCPQDTPLVAADRLGKTAWSINVDVLEIVEHYENKGVRGLPLSPGTIREQLKDGWSTRAEGRLSDYMAAYKGEYVTSRKVLSRARQLAKVPKFYCPHLADARGRLYPGPDLSALSPDLGRGLLQFHRGATVQCGGPGYRELAEYGATLFGIKEDGSGSRVQWSMSDGLALAERTATTWDRDDSFLLADEPWQFAAWCLEWHRLHAEGSIVSYFPTFIDGTANGLQLYSLILGDLNLAQLVNVLPGEKPMDIYGILLKVIVSRIEESSDPDLRAWLGHSTFLDRKLVKKILLAQVFNQGSWGQRESLKEHLVKVAVDNGRRPKRGIRRMAWALQALLVEICADYLHSLYVGQAFMSELGAACSSKEMNVEFASPSGFPVRIDKRRDRNAKTVKMWTGEDVTMRRGASDRVHDTRQMRRSTPSAVIQSLDAAILHRWASLMPEGAPVAARHDGFGTLCVDMATAREALSSALGGIPWESFLISLGAVTVGRLGSGASVPEPPRYGMLDPSLVTRSPYAYH